MAVVVFNPATFRIYYPEFSAVSDAQLTAYFHRAELYLDNTDCSPVQDIQRRTILFGMLVAHIAAITPSSSSNARPFGRVTTATEGTVSVGFGGPPASAGSQEWYLQSQYGAEYWYATAQYRTMHYICEPTVY